MFTVYKISFRGMISDMKTLLHDLVFSTFNHYLETRTVVKYYDNNVFFMQLVNFNSTYNEKIEIWVSIYNYLKGKNKVIKCIF